MWVYLLEKPGIKPGPGFCEGGDPKTGIFCRCPVLWNSFPFATRQGGNRQLLQASCADLPFRTGFPLTYKAGLCFCVLRTSALFTFVCFDTAVPLVLHCTF